MKQVIASSSKELIKQYNDLNSGHFFDTDTMRFFKSKVTTNYKRLNDYNVLFITTEKSPFSDFRFATIRHANLIRYTSNEKYDPKYKIVISTAGEFNKMTLSEAKSMLKKITLDQIPRYIK